MFVAVIIIIFIPTISPVLLQHLLLFVCPDIMRVPAAPSLLAASAAAKNAVPAFYDGSCYYPKPDIGFDLNSYLGRWYQVAGTIAPYNANCKCTFAQYALNVSGTKTFFPPITDSTSRMTAVSGSTTLARLEPVPSASSVLLHLLVPSTDRPVSTVCNSRASGLRTAPDRTTLCRVSFGCHHFRRLGFLTSLQTTPATSLSSSPTTSAPCLS